MRNIQLALSNKGFELGAVDGKAGKSLERLHCRERLLETRQPFLQTRQPLPQAV